MRIIVCAWMIIDIWGGGGGRERTVWYVWMEWSFFFFFCRDIRFWIYFTSFSLRTFLALTCYKYVIAIMVFVSLYDQNTFFCKNTNPTKARQKKRKI